MKKNLSRLTVTRLRIVAAAILKEPEYYSQNSTDRLRRSKDMMCKSAACIFGWAVALFVEKGKKRRGGCMSRLGARALGLKGWSGGPFLENGSQAKRLYCPDAWPPKFIGALRQAEVCPNGAFTAACVAVARIEHFIATNGRQ